MSGPRVAMDADFFATDTAQVLRTDLNNNWTDKLCLNSEAAGCHYLQWKDPHCRAPSWAAVAAADRRKWSLVYWRLA